VAQPLLEAGQHGFIVSRLDIDYPVGRQPCLGNGWGKEILPNNTPQNLTLGPGNDARREQSRGSAIDRAIAAAGNLMQRAHGQATARQTQIHRRQTKGQNLGFTPATSLDSSDFLAQTLNDSQWEHKTAFR
jgi:hypothetical protein